MFEHMKVRSLDYTFHQNDVHQLNNTIHSCVAIVHLLPQISHQLSDEIVHFSKCDALMINQLMDLFYNGCVEDAYTEEQIQRYKHIENIFSPSDINKVCFNNINSREKGEEFFMKVNES